MSRVALPSYEQVCELPCYLRREVPAEYEDANGHMTVAGYLATHSDAAWPWMASLGMDAAYITDRQMSMFDLEHHLRYLGEVMLGDTVAVHGRMVERTAKLLHGVWFLLDVGHRRISNTFEFVSAHVTLETRRTSPFQPDIAEAIDAVLAVDKARPWPAPLSGALAVGPPAAVSP